APFGGQAEPAVGLRTLDRQEQVAADHEVGLAFVHGRGTLLVVGAVGRTRRAGAAAELLLVAAEEREVRPDPGRDLVGQLERRVLQLRAIVTAGQRDDVDVRLAGGAPGP